MKMDSRKSLLEILKHTLTSEFDRDLVDAYAKNFDYDDLDRAFRDQLVKEVAREDET